ncbi:hypothetical protein JY651_49730 [Pyxidicoccus parkwayensis]|uniref:Uncharacterized protein n=1 Tax=Pyxidicoccus parkwayensis TaxID=2813578 RepID=A0ABX7NVY8_9BACT|nr:hypothetical protein [Pyxidicoccus parkwaysis]QSQ23085.1 hypothetical protein JY651_49730 [Pyxidicoccus parkwaysis]
MNTKLYVLGAVLGAAPGLPPEALSAPVASPQESRPDSRGASRKGRGGRATGATTRGTSDSEVPRHPCELITIIQVPCDATKATCEYTYWKCPEVVSPLRS